MISIVPSIEQFKFLFKIGNEILDKHRDVSDRGERARFEPRPEGLRSRGWTRAWRLDV